MRPLAGISHHSIPWTLNSPTVNSPTFPRDCSICYIKVTVLARNRYRFLELGQSFFRAHVLARLTHALLIMLNYAMMPDESINLVQMLLNIFNQTFNGFDGFIYSLEF